MRQVPQFSAFAPVGKPTRGLVIGPPRVLVADIRGEETEEPLRCFLIGQKQRRELRGQASERTLGTLAVQGAGPSRCSSHIQPKTSVKELGSQVKQESAGTGRMEPEGERGCGNETRSFISQGSPISKTMRKSLRVIICVETTAVCQRTCRRGNY